MKIQCDVCEKKEASVFCAADEAALCEGCDYRVHHANKLASKHLRFSLLHPSFKEAPLCDICQEKRAFLFCKEDRAILCRECDIPIHKSNEHTQNHNRFLLTGVKISATQPNKSSPKSSSNNSYDQNSISHTKSSSITMSSSDHDIFNQNSCYYSNNSINNNNININNNISTPSSTTMNYNQVYEEGSISTNNDFSSDYLMESLPGWRLEDMFDSSPAFHNHCKIFDYTNMNPVNTNQELDESMGRFGSENESMMWGFHNEGPLVPSHLPANFLQRF